MESNETPEGRSVVESNAATEGGGGVWMEALENDALTLDSTLTSDKTDWGDDKTDNTPEDINVEDSGLYDEFGAGESFSCDSSTGTCE